MWMCGSKIRITPASSREPSVRLRAVGWGVRDGEPVEQGDRVGRQAAAGGGAFLGEGGEHAGEDRVGAVVEAVDGAERDLHEDALDDALAPGGGVEVGGVRAERGGDEPSVV